MIRPTPRLIALAAVGAPVGLIVAAAVPQAWGVGLAWMVLVVALGLVDALSGAARGAAQVETNAPGAVFTGRPEAIDLRVAFPNGPRPAALDAVLETNARFEASPSRVRTRPDAEGVFTLPFTLDPVRRGEGLASRLWLTWTGPLRLLEKRRVVDLDQTIPVVPDTKTVAKEAIRIFSRYSLAGVKPQSLRGDGSEFDALKEFAVGMDPRAIDWKQSARHRNLMAKEFKVEHNHTIVFAIDTGRLMCEPVDGVARVDHALNASLLLAFVSLKLGDRAAVFGFDAKPRLATGAVSGPGAFPLLQRASAALDYSEEETNYTLGLTTLSGGLKRRSLVVVFTEFADPTNAELLIENLARLMKRHLVVFVAFRDAELETIARAEPHEPEDVARAVLASSLLRERAKVIVRLQRMGVEVLEAPAAKMGPALLNRYLDLVKQDRI